MTSWHNIKSSLGINVQFADATESEAELVSTKSQYDLAIIQAYVIPDNAVPATLTTASGLQVGDKVVVIGNPFGMGCSLSSGVVSALDRTFQSTEASRTLNNLIQFDAAINKGSSGGPLVDCRGEVVGIVTALLNPTDQGVFIGIGFAMPIEMASKSMSTPWW